VSKKSNSKGAAFERRVRDMFRESWGVQLERTPQSGGWGRSQTKGDLVSPTNTRFPYFVECKNQQQWNLWGTLFESQGELLNWWDKACKQAKEEGGKVPLVIVGQDYQPPLVLLKPTLRCHGIPQAFIISNDNKTLCLMRLIDFLKNYQS
jgi:hypothetical protein